MLRRKKKNIFYLFMKWLHGEKEKKALLFSSVVEVLSSVVWFRSHQFAWHYKHAGTAPACNANACITVNLQVCIAYTMTRCALQSCTIQPCQQSPIKTALDASSCTSVVRSSLRDLATFLSKFWKALSDWHFGPGFSGKHWNPWSADAYRACGVRDEHLERGIDQVRVFGHKVCPLQRPPLHLFEDFVSASLFSFSASAETS